MEKERFIKLLKPKEVAQQYNISLSYVYKLMSEGKLTYYQLGRAKRIDPRDMEKIVKHNTDWRKYFD